MEVLGGVHEGGVLEVFVACTVDVGGGFLTELIDVGSVDAVLADEEHPLLDFGVGYLSCLGCFRVVAKLECSGQCGVGQVLHRHLVALHL